MPQTHEPPTLDVLIIRCLAPLLRPYYHKLVKKLALRGDERILDFGSGPGLAAVEIAKHLSTGGRLTCLDVSATWVRLLRKRLRRFDNVDFVLGPLAGAALATGSYDLIFVHFALHEIPAEEAPETLKTLKSLLKEDGLLYIREPYDDGHGHGLTAEEAEAMLAEAGFEKVRGGSFKLRLMGRVFEGVFRHAKAKPALLRA